MRHTQGPWITRYTATQDGDGGNQEHSVVHYRNEHPYNETPGEYICRRVRTEADAIRITACVNACEGIEDPAEFIAEAKRRMAHDPTAA